MKTEREINDAITELLQASERRIRGSLVWHCLMAAASALCWATEKEGEWEADTAEWFDSMVRELAKNNKFGAS